MFYSIDGKNDFVNFSFLSNEKQAENQMQIALQCYDLSNFFLFIPMNYDDLIYVESI